MVRRCQKCKKQKPITEYRLKGRGRRRICNECLPTYERPPPDHDADILKALLETNDLLRSPRCSRCGGAGAEMGNPPEHEGCR
jgi:hypothetical protein